MTDTSKEVGTTTKGDIDLISEPRKAPREDMSTKTAVTYMVIVFLIAILSGAAVWAGGQFDGGRPGITAPADGQGNHK